MTLPVGVVTFPGSPPSRRTRVGAEPTLTVSGMLAVPPEELRTALGSTLPARFD